MGKIVNVSLLALIAMLSVPGALSCDDGWIGMGDSCYKTSPDPVNWFQAEEVQFIHLDLILNHSGA